MGPLNLITAQEEVKTHKPVKQPVPKLDTPNTGQLQFGSYGDICVQKGMTTDFQCMEVQGQFVCV
jgi:hypothetical protein